MGGEDDTPFLSFYCLDSNGFWIDSGFKYFSPLFELGVGDDILYIRSLVHKNGDSKKDLKTYLETAYIL